MIIATDNSWLKMAFVWNEIIHIFGRSLLILFIIPTSVQNCFSRQIIGAQLEIHTILLGIKIHFDQEWSSKMVFI